MPTQYSAQYQDRVAAAATQRELRELRETVEKMQRNGEAEKFERINAERHAKLESLRHQGYVFDVDEAAAETKADKCSDEGFARYAERIVKHYERAPVGRNFMPTPPLDGWKADQARKEATPQQAREARENVLKMQRDGKEINDQTYNDELKRIVGSNGHAVAPAG